MSIAPCTPLAGAVAVQSRTASETTTTFDVDASEPVFAGHYVGFPIFPGVCLIELAHRSALATAPHELELASVDAARFLSPVFPGDRVTADLRWSSADGARRVSVDLSTGRARAAQVRLRYRGGERQ